MLFFHNLFLIHVAVITFFLFAIMVVIEITWLVSQSHFRVSFISIEIKFNIFSLFFVMFVMKSMSICND